MLAGLARCSLTSLRYHCRRMGVELSSRASVRGTVTRRAEDGRFAFVEIAVEADVAFEPKPDDQTVADLLMKGERDCFVGASLTAQPTYDWRVACAPRASTSTPSAHGSRRSIGHWPSSTGPAGHSARTR